MRARLRRARRAGVALACAACAVAAPASASAPELFGLGSEDAALASASSARASGFAATFYNPAGLARGRREFSLGLVGFASRLRVDGPAGATVRPIVHPFGVVVGAAAPVPLRAWLADRLFIGVAVHVDPAALVRIVARAPDEPFFPYYENRTQRLVVLPALAVRIGWGLSAGVAINYLAGLRGQVEAAEGITRAVEPRVDEAITANAAVHAGLLWRSAHDRASAALVYRQRFSVPFTTTTRARIAGEPLDLAIDAEGLYTPDTVVAGAAVRPLPWLRASADLGAALWSSWRGPYVLVDSALPFIGPRRGEVPRLAYRDAVSLRVGVEIERPVDPLCAVRVRAGYGFETSPLPDEQPGVTNLLDGFKHFAAAGLGLRFTRGPVAVRVDAHGQLHALHARTIEKRLASPGESPDSATALRDERPDDPDHPETLGPQVSNPGWPRITGGGTVWSAGLTLTVER